MSARRIPSSRTSDTHLLSLKFGSITYRPRVYGQQLDQVWIRLAIKAILAPEIQTNQVWVRFEALNKGVFILRMPFLKHNILSRFLSPKKERKKLSIRPWPRRATFFWCYSPNASSDEVSNFIFNRTRLDSV